MGYSEIVWRAYLNQKSLKLSLRFCYAILSVEIHKLSLQSSHALKLPGKLLFIHLCHCVRGVYFTQKNFYTSGTYWVDGDAQVKLCSNYRFFQKLPFPDASFDCYTVAFGIR